MDKLNSAEFIGAVAGSFIAVAGAIGLLFLTEWWRTQKAKRELKASFIKELRYLKSIMKQCERSLEQLMGRVSVGDTGLYFSFEATNMLSVASQKAYSEGLLFDILEPEQLAEFNAGLTYFGGSSAPLDEYIRGRIDNFQEGKITQQDLYGTLEFTKEKTIEFIKLLSKIEKQAQKKRKS